MGIPGTARAGRSGLLQTSRDLPPAFPLSVASTMAHTPLLPSWLCGKVFLTPVCRTSFPFFGLVGAPILFPLSQRPRAASDPLKILQQCAHCWWCLHGLFTCLYSSVGKSSLCVVATADGALLFPDVLCAVWVRVLGRLKQTNRVCVGGEKLATGDIGSL